MFPGSGGIFPPRESGPGEGLAVAGARRSVWAPDIPTIAEAGAPGHDGTRWRTAWPRPQARRKR